MGENADTLAGSHDQAFIRGTASSQPGSSRVLKLLFHLRGWTSVTPSIISTATSCDEMGVLTSQDICNKKQMSFQMENLLYGLEQIS